MDFRVGYRPPALPWSTRTVFFRDAHDEMVDYFLTVEEATRLRDDLTLAISVAAKEER